MSAEVTYPSHEDYQSWIQNIKNKIHESQQRATLAVNHELVSLYWFIGNEILSQQKKFGWGAKVLDRIANDLRSAFPEAKGFSRANLHNMRAFAEFWSKDEIVQAPLGQLTWYHLTTLQTKLKTKQECLKYAHLTVEYGWSRNTMVHHIEAKTAERLGKSTTNFDLTLPTSQSDLAIETLKDPYKFDFLNLSPEAKEKEIETALIDKIRDFLLELGVGFAFIGSQVHIEVNGDDFYIDLLFYHTQLHCYFVLELKTCDFKPEHLGQLSFYVSAVDTKMKSTFDNPTIGLLLCKSRNKVVAEYTLKNINQPIGISDYQISALPKTEDFENILSEK